MNAKRITQTGSGGSSRVVWDRVEAAAASHPAHRPSHTTSAVGANGRIVPGSGAASNASAFPALGAQQKGPSSTATPQPAAWSTGGTGSALDPPPEPSGPTIRSVNYPLPAPSNAKAPSQTAFPSLPSTNGTTAKRQALFNKPNPRGESIRRIMGQAAAAPPPKSHWGSVANAVEAMQVADGIAEVAEDRPPGKKKGKGKQLLFTVSARPS